MSIPGKVLALLVLSIIWLASAGPASAHADIVRADPAPNGVYPAGTLSHVTLEFDEELEPLFSSIEVFNSHLERVDAASNPVNSIDPHVFSVELESLAPDSYTVVWRVVSVVDGHSSSGVYTFQIVEAGSVELGNGEVALIAATAPSTSTASVSAWEVGLRWLRLSAGLIAFGTVVIARMVLSKLRVKSDREETSFWFAVDQSSNRLLLGAVLLWLLTGIAWLGFQSTVVGQMDLAAAMTAGIPIQLLSSRLGQVWALQLMLGFALLGLQWSPGLLALEPAWPDRRLCLRYRCRKDRQEQVTARQRRAPGGLAGAEILLAAAMLGSLAFSSHAAAGALWPSLSTMVDWLHLLANGAWIGGLVALVLAFLPALKLLPEESRRGMLTQTFRSFSPLAAVGLILSVATGAFAAALQFLTPADVVETSYGWTFLLKLALIAPILLFALGNALILRSEKSELRLPGHKWWRGRLSSMVRIEAVLGLLVLFVTAMLTAIPTPPPRPIPPNRQIPFNSKLEEIVLPEKGLQAFVALAPNYIGWNRYMIVLQDLAGMPVSDAERVRFRFYLPEADFRTDWLNAQQAQDGLYVANGQDMVAVGEWQIEVDIRRLGTVDTRFTLDWEMVAPPTTLVDPATPRAANWFALAGVGLAAAALVVSGLSRKTALAA